MIIQINTIMYIHVNPTPWDPGPSEIGAAERCAT